MDHTTSLTELIGNAKRQLDLLGYADGTKKHYILNWNHFSKYAEQKKRTYFSEELGNAFLEDYCGIKAGMELLASQVFKVRTITVLAELLIDAVIK